MVNHYPIYAIERDSKGINSMIQVLSPLHLTPQFVFLERTEDIIVAVESGSGIAFLPHRRVKECVLLGSITAYPLTEMEYTGIEITAIWNKKNNNPLIEQFLNNIVVDDV